MNYEKWSDVAKKVQEPFKAMAELNLKTLQNLSYIKPEELTHVKKPEELWEKQMSVAFENGHKAMDYMQKSFQIIEKSMLSMIQEIKVKTDTHSKK